jgi:hypothetical protein
VFPFCEYNHKMELLPWVNFNKLSFIMLNSNPNIGEFMDKSPYYIIKDWILLSGNPGALPILLKNPDKINLTLLVSNTNPAALPLIKSKTKGKHVQNAMFQANPITFGLIDAHKINWHTICSNTNPKAIKLIQCMIDDGLEYKLDWSLLSGNPSAISILEQHQDKVVWSVLSSNPAAIHLLLQNRDKINYKQLCRNRHPTAIEIIRTLSPNLIYWPYLCSNPTAIDFLEENQQHIHWFYLSGNPAIFRYNYTKMASIRNELIRDELLSVALHPSRISNWLRQGILLSEI